MVGCQPWPPFASALRWLGFVAPRVFTKTIPSSEGWRRILPQRDTLRTHPHRGERPGTVMASEAEHEARRRAEAIANSALEEGHADEQATLHEKLDDLARSVSSQLASLAAAVGTLAERQGETEEKRQIQQGIIENMQTESQET